MNWYYVEQGQQAGPVNDNQLAELLRTGKINADALVWREGMAEWLPFNRVRTDLKSFAAPPVVAPASASAEGSTDTPIQSSEAVCAECGKVFPADEMIRHGNARICASCKPIFMQKLAEGAPVLAAGELNYAGILTRFAAVFLDGLIVSVVNILVGFLFGMNLAQSVGTKPQALTALPIVFLAVKLAVAMAYEVILIGKYGATLGKMACKIKVVTADGGKVSYARSLGRYFAKMLSAFTCLIGYIIAIFDKPQRRALHDHICNTRVIQK
jgi:uncharacterized RDD family membrane protein YckC